MQGLALVDDMDGEKPERFVAGNREGAVRNVPNFDLGGASLAGKTPQNKNQSLGSRSSTHATQSYWGT